MEYLEISKTSWTDIGTVTVSNISASIDGDNLAIKLAADNASANTQSNIIIVPDSDVTFGNTSSLQQITRYMLNTNPYTIIYFDQDILTTDYLTSDLTPLADWFNNPSANPSPYENNETFLVTRFISDATTTVFLTGDLTPLADWFNNPSANPSPYENKPGTSTYSTGISNETLWIKVNDASYSRIGQITFRLEDSNGLDISSGVSLNASYADGYSAPIYNDLLTNNWTVTKKAGVGLEGFATDTWIPLLTVPTDVSNIVIDNSGSGFFGDTDFYWYSVDGSGETAPFSSKADSVGPDNIRIVGSTNIVVSGSSNLTSSSYAVTNNISQESTTDVGYNNTYITNDYNDNNGNTYVGNNDWNNLTGWANQTNSHSKPPAPLETSADFSYTFITNVFNDNNGHLYATPQNDDWNNLLNWINQTGTYEKPPAPPSFVYQERLVDPNGGSSDQLGWSVAISQDGKYIVGSAPEDDDISKNAGALHVWSLNGKLMSIKKY